MPATLIQALKRAQARVTQLQAAVDASQTKELAGLPTKFGFSDVHEFAAAVVAANGRTSKRRIPAPSKAGARMASGAR